MKKTLMALAILPMFAIVGCTEEQEQTAAQSGDNFATVADPSRAATTDDGAIAAAQLIQSYKDAQDNGYTGTIEQWAALVQLQQTDPAAAQKVAEESGFSGSEMFLAGLAGAAVGALAAGAMSNRTGLASGTYSSQRVSNTTNYAVSQPYKQEDRRTTSGGGAVVSTASSNSSVSRPAAMPAPRPSVSTSSVSRPTASVPTSSIARGGFGGAVSSGG